MSEQEGWAGEAQEEKVEEAATQEVATPAKPADEGKLHDTARAAKDAPMLELILPVGMEMELSKVPMVVTKVDGMTVTLKRTDIVG